MKSGTSACALFLASVLSAFCQSSSSLNCKASSVTALVRAEGVTERIGEIVFDCTGTPNTVIDVHLTLFLPVEITNRVGAGNSADAQLTVDTGAGPASYNAKVQFLTANTLVFSGVIFTVPASGRASIRINNVRVTPPPGQQFFDTPVQAFLSVSSGIVVNSTMFMVARSRPGLLASSASKAVSCRGAILPASRLLTELVGAKAVFSSTRVTEGFAEAFQSRGPFTDSGTRILVRYSGFPDGTRLLVPDVVVGSSSLAPTSGGDLGLAVSGGTYQPGTNGALLLARVMTTDSNGAGGAPVYTPGALGSSAVDFNTVNDVPLVNGAGMAVYEVVDANATILESAQFPTFFGIPSNPSGRNIVASVEVMLGPLSDAPAASSTAPIPRFAASTPSSDCAALGDCNAAYFPHLAVNAPALDFTAPSDGGSQTKYLDVSNSGSGLLRWTAAVQYKSGNGWLRIHPSSGLNDSVVRLDASSQGLALGTYQAVLTFDAGPLAGTRSLDVSFVVTPFVPPPPAVPRITAATNAASFASGPLVAGSLATIWGTALQGKSVAVTFDGLPAAVLYGDDRQINVRVPEALQSQNSAEVRVKVDDLDSLPFAVALAGANPGIFPNGILNQDNSLNSAASPALPGSAIQIWLTGLLSPQVTSVTARIADRNIAFPAYFGPAPGFAGLHQVNLAIPDDLPAMATQVFVCSLTAARPESPICSPPVPLVIGAR